MGGKRLQVKEGCETPPKGSLRGMIWDPPDTVANLHVESGDFLGLQWISRWQPSVPLEKNGLFGGRTVHSTEVSLLPQPSTLNLQGFPGLRLAALPPAQP